MFENVAVYEEKNVLIFDDFIRNVVRLFRMVGNGSSFLKLIWKPVSLFLLILIHISLVYIYWLANVNSIILYLLKVA